MTVALPHLLLALTVTSDVFEHIMVLRQVPLFWKLLLICQCLIATNICFLNASITASNSNPVDILMNSTGLLVLNDMDNIVFLIFGVF